MCIIPGMTPRQALSAASMLALLQLGTGCAGVPNDAAELEAECTLGPCVGIGTWQSFADAEIMPVEVVSDSRCPADARCVWPGELTLEARVLTDAGEARLVLNSAKPTDHRDVRLEIVEIAPIPTTQSMPIAPSAYRFRFEVTPLGTPKFAPG